MNEWTNKKDTRIFIPISNPRANKSKQNFYPVNTLNTHSFQLETQAKEWSLLVQSNCTFSAPRAGIDLVFFHYKGGANNSHCAVSETLVWTFAVEVFFSFSLGLVMSSKLTMTSDSSTCHAVCVCCALSGEQGPLCSLYSVNRVIEQFPVWWFAKSKLLLESLAPHQEGRSRSGVPTRGTESNGPWVVMHLLDLKTQSPKEAW